MASIAVAGLTKHFGVTHAVGPIDLGIAAGEFVSLLGPSGCGKTTTLRMIAGFEEPTAGSIRIGDADMRGVAVERRGIGMVFQSYALFPHLSVFENVAFGLRLKRISKDRIEADVKHVLGLVDLAAYGARMPRELSGGQQQRVALARALAVQPTVLLLDEPLSNLDLKLREQMRDEIRRLQRRVGITALYVTHDQGEAMAMSDRIAVMNRGLVEQIGTPREVYEKPSSLFVARFIGQCSVLEGRLEAVDGTVARFVSRAGTPFIVECEGRAGSDAAAGLVIRPEFVELRTRSNEGAAVNAMDAVVEEAVYVGERIDLTLRLAHGDPILVAQRASPGRPLPQPGDRVVIAVSPSELSLVPLPTEAAP